uniref:Uncharacterized protein n=1 Tax=Nelumbo nucifera TaxID=4432 RepID=A0A822YJH9_NELNU|nr:TPA_asm: hypothetical protein HUJ06_011528 [Nelumbo nucifera]
MTKVTLHLYLDKKSERSPPVSQMQAYAFTPFFIIPCKTGNSNAVH